MYARSLVYRILYISISRASLHTTSFFLWHSPPLYILMSTIIIRLPSIWSSLSRPKSIVLIYCSQLNNWIINKRFRFFCLRLNIHHDVLIYEDKPFEKLRLLITILTKYDWYMKKKPQNIQVLCSLGGFVHWLRGSTSSVSFSYSVWFSLPRHVVIMVLSANSRKLYPGLPSRRI